MNRKPRDTIHSKYKGIRMSPRLIALIHRARLPGETWSAAVRRLVEATLRPSRVGSIRVDPGRSLSAVSQRVLKSQV